MMEAAFPRKKGITLFQLSLLLLISLLALGCGSNSTKNKVLDEESIDPTNDSSPIAQGDNSRVSLDWAGTYKGTIPCASCEGIETMLTLNSDATYLLKTHYLGRNDDLEQEMSGKFDWDDSGSMITLQNLEGIPGMYKVGENQLWHLDDSGQRITGDLASHYILKKQQN